MKEVIFQCSPLCAANIYHRLHFRSNLKNLSNQRREYLFIHIPKSAGTSVSKSLKMPDIGHYTYTEMLSFGFDMSPVSQVFVVYRDPVERFLSAYSYMRKRAFIGKTTLPFIRKTKNVDQFVDFCAKKINIKKHYFFRPFESFVAGVPDEKLNIIMMDRLGDCFLSLYRDYGIGDGQLSIENRGEKVDLKMSEFSRRWIQKEYKNDYKYENSIYNYPLAGPL